MNDIGWQRHKPDFPYWLVALIFIGVGIAALIIANADYQQIFLTVASGLWTTIFAALTSFALASLFGLVIALLGMSGNIFLRQVARFYVEVIRGLPALVLLFYIAFVGAPSLVWLGNTMLQPLIEKGLMDEFLVRDFSMLWRAIVALTICYSAFLAEIFRAGIQSIDRGQIDAAKALGLNSYQRFRLIVAPQAFRTIFPAWSNDFIAIIKDSSLVSVLGVADMTQMAKVYSAGSFRFFETYSILAYIYLVIAIGLSHLLRSMEQKMKRQIQ